MTVVNKLSITELIAKIKRLDYASSIYLASIYIGEYNKATAVDDNLTDWYGIKKIEAFGKSMIVICSLEANDKCALVTLDFNTALEMDLKEAIQSIISDTYYEVETINF